MRGYISKKFKTVIAVAVSVTLLGGIIIKVFYRREEYIIVPDSYVGDVSIPKIYLPEGNKVDIDIYRILNETHKFLSKDDIGSDVFAFNNIDVDCYRYKNQDFYDILSRVKDVFVCSDGKMSSRVVSDDLDCVLVNKTTAKKLKGDVTIDLDDFIGACVLRHIARQVREKQINDYCLMYEDVLLLCGNQNKKTSGWNVSKDFKYMGEINDNSDTVENEQQKTVENQQQKKEEEYSYYIPYDLYEYDDENENNDDVDDDYEIEYQDPFERINMPFTENNGFESVYAENTITTNLVGIKDKALCFIKPNKVNNIIGGVVMTDDVLLSKTIAMAAEKNGFAVVDYISSRLRYDDCQYFILYYNSEGGMEMQKSCRVNVKENNNCWRATFYGR